MTRSAAEVEAEVEASRNELDRNMEALRSKMTPGQLFDEAARMAGGTGQQVASKFVEQAKANPMPLAVMGLGLAWLMVSNNKQSASTYGYGYASPEPRSYAAEGGYGGGWDGGDYGEASRSHGGLAAGVKDRVQGLGEKAQGVGHDLSDKARNLGDKASEMISGAREKLAGGAASISDSGRNAAQGLSQGIETMAGNVRQQAAQVGQQAQRTFLDTLHSEPMLIAGLGIIVGAAIGAALPSTPAEDKYLGETRDKLLNKGKDLAHTGLQQASTAAQAAYGSVKDELAQGADGADLTDRVESAARSGAQAVRDSLQQGPAH